MIRSLLNLIIASLVLVSAKADQSSVKNSPNGSPHVHAEYIELSHPLSDQTIHWPANSGFKYTASKNESVTAGNLSYHLLSDNIDMAIHTGTHLDAPVHFSNESQTVDKIPLGKLVNVPCHVIDLSSKVTSSRNYNFAKDDFIHQATKESLVKPQSVLLVYTGISKDYEKGAAYYFGLNTTDASNQTIAANLKDHMERTNFPGFSKEAAEYLASQNIYGVGLDAPSADGSTTLKDGKMEAHAHVVFNSRNIFILENVHQNLERLLNSKGCHLTMLPLPITGGSGSPVRLLGTKEHPECNSAKNSASSPGITIFSMAAVLFATLLMVTCNVGTLF